MLITTANILSMLHTLYSAKWLLFIRLRSFIFIILAFMMLGDAGNYPLPRNVCPYLFKLLDNFHIFSPLLHF